MTSFRYSERKRAHSRRQSDVSRPACPSDWRANFQPNDRTVREGRSDGSRSDAPLSASEYSAPEAWSDEVLLATARRVDHESRTATADVVRLESDRVRRQQLSASSSATPTDAKRSNETTATAARRVEVAMDRVEKLALQRLAVDSELAK